MSSSTLNRFDELDRQLSSGGVDAVFERLLADLRREKKYHELFDAMLMRSRHALGLPVVLSTSLDDLDEPVRTRLEEAYLAACREVGTLLLAEGQLREAWMYLRPVGEKGLMADALAKIEPGDDNLQDLIEIALHEGVAPTLGYGLVLRHYGTCNAITTFEGSMLARPKTDQQAGARMLLEHLHQELLSYVRADITRQSGAAPEGSTLAELVADRDWLFLDNNYHTDTTHLAAAVRFSRLLEDRGSLALAYDLTEYGRRLAKQFQFAGEEPFADMYPSHALFFAAQMGQQQEQAIEYFAERARETNVHEQGTGPAEIYIALLARLGRYREAMAATQELIPAGARTSGFAPNMLELARLADDFSPLLESCRQRQDVVGYTAGLVERATGQ